jgi:long-subunit fatty acid transport protein
MLYKTALTIFLLSSFVTAQRAEDALRPFIGAGGPGSRANGLGQAFTGVADDATALFYNPAGLANLTRTELNLGLDHLSVTTDIIPLSAGQSATIAATRLNSIGFVIPIPDAKATAAIGYHMTRAFERKREQYTGDTDDPRLEEITEEGKLGIWSFGLGYQISTMAAIGAGIDIFWGKNTYTESGTYIYPPEDPEHFTIEPTYTGLGLNLGILLAPLPTWRVGLLVRSPQNLHAEEEERYYDEVTIREYNTRSTYSLRLGSSLNLGPVLLAADACWFDYSQIRFDSDLTDTLGQFIDVGINNTIRSQYRGTLGYAVGGEWLLPLVNGKVRAGYRMTPNENQDAPTKMDQQTLSAGLSFVPIPQLKLDTAYSITTWQRDLDSSVHEETSITNLTFSIIYRF